MSFFLLFLIVSFLCGLFLYEVPLEKLAWVVAGIAVVMAIGYYFFDRI
ncbi:hypothetical protein [Candidatus Viridilinea mediisalina]|nr:hypothetical protein [Candidatus Viridilinea mediisalina]